MIFVTVGTHEQPFDRLIHCVDEWKREGILTEDVVIQTGYSTFQPAFCSWSPFYSYEDVENYIKKAHMVITHGGPSTIFMCIENGSIPIVIPRRAEYGEHVNNHQVVFCKTLEEHQNNILLVDSTDVLLMTILNYDELAKKRLLKMTRNNEQFCKDFARQVELLYE